MKRVAADVGAVAVVLVAASLVAGCERSGPVEPGPALTNAPGADPASLFAAVLPGSQVIQVPGDYPTIQAAVDAAAEGANIQVRAGTYAERVLITRSGLRLHASAGVILDGTTVGGTGIHVLGTATQPVTGVEIEGFEVANFERGIIVQWGSGARVHRNEVHHSADLIPGYSIGEASGIGLWGTANSEVSQNRAHHNAEDGIQVLRGSTRNVVRGNEAYANGGAPQANGNPYPGSGVMLTGATPAGLATSDNEILENKLMGNLGWGIRIARPAGTAPLSGTRVAQNQIHGNRHAGIGLMGSVSGSIIVQNDARGNNLSGLPPCYQCNLMDGSTGVNRWERNLGTFNLADPSCLSAGGPM